MLLVSINSFLQHVELLSKMFLLLYHQLLVLLSLFLVLLFAFK